MANWQQVARRAARRYGLDPNVFARQINQESGFNPAARSPAGALGIAQFMPGTARSVGVNPLNPRQALYGAARLMAGYVRRYGSYRNALIAYNAGPGAVGRGSLPAETRNYIASILNGRNPPVGGVRGGGRVVRTPGQTGVPGLPGSVLSLGGGASPDLSSNTSVEALLKALQGASKPAVSSMPLTAPGFSAGPRLPTGYQAPASSVGRSSKGTDLNSLLSAIRTRAPQLGGAAGSVVGLPPTAGVPGVPGTSRRVGGGGGRVGHVTIASGANRAGVGINPAVIEFARRVAGLYGSPLRIGTGSNHSRLTVNGTVSDHWSGNAVDIPLSGRALVRAGQDALIAAGMPAARARRVRGGGFNLGGFQVIFNTNAPGWGNHLDHLHIGRRSR